MLTKEDVEFVERLTGWVPRERGEKFVVASSGRRACHEDLGGAPTYYELVLLQQAMLRLTLWVEPGRYAVQANLARELRDWAPTNSHQTQIVVRGQLDGGHAIDFVLDIPVESWVMRLEEVKNIVDEVHLRLRQVGIPI